MTLCLTDPFSYVSESRLRCLQSPTTLIVAARLTSTALWVVITVGSQERLTSLNYGLRTRATPTDRHHVHRYGRLQQAGTEERDRRARTVGGTPLTAASDFSAVQRP